jgi:hypothetical protein
VTGEPKPVGAGGAGGADGAGGPPIIPGLFVSSELSGSGESSGMDNSLFSGSSKSIPVFPSLFSASSTVPAGMAKAKFTKTSVPNKTNTLIFLTLIISFIPPFLLILEFRFFFIMNHA